MESLWDIAENVRTSTVDIEVQEWKTNRIDPLNSKLKTIVHFLQEKLKLRKMSVNGMIVKPFFGNVVCFF